MPAPGPAPRPFPYPADPRPHDPHPDGPAAGIFLPGEVFAAAELAAMALEGVVREVLPRAYAPARVPDGPHLRAAAAGLLAGRRLGGKRRGDTWSGDKWMGGGAVGRLSAAWVHGCCPAPQRLEVLVPRFHRLPAHADPLPVQLSEARLGAEDIVRIAGVPVTSPPRTAVDVALCAPEAESLAVLARLFAAPGLGCTGQAVLDLLEDQARRPGKLRARERIERVLGAGAQHPPVRSGAVR